MSSDRRNHHRRQTTRRTAALKQRAQKLASGNMKCWESETLPAGAREQFWDRVIDFETAPTTTDFERLIDAGLELPEPDASSDEQLHATLWKVIAALADLGVFIEHTNHLSDRELYARLWRNVLRQSVPVVDEGVWHVDLLGGGSEEDTELFLKHYADDEWRQHWCEEFPDYPLPPHEDPPYDRDRLLPKPYEPAPRH
jgi:hypothetical protein